MKLPKDMRKKRKKVRNMRTRGSRTGKVGTNKSVKGLNRQMRRKLQNQGIEGMEQIEATRVIIETEDSDMVIDEPQVIKVEQGGVEMFQVIGDAVEREKGEIQMESSPEDFMEEEFEAEEIEEDFTIEITEQDVQLVASQTGVSKEEAENALKEANGDLAKAILALKTQ